MKTKILVAIIATVLILFGMYSSHAETKIIKWDSKCGNTKEFVESYGAEQTAAPENPNWKDIQRWNAMLKQGTVLLQLDDGSYYLYSVYKDKVIYGQFVTLIHK